MDSTHTRRQPGASSQAGPRSGSRYRGHRRDIDGLRGLAIALVVIFHVFVGRVSSGVDVFLLLGGIFFFSPQIRNALNPAGLTVVQSFLRIFRRLYPALITVVTVAVIASVLIFNRVRWPEVGEDAGASLLYMQNLHLANLGQEYTAVNREVSVFQHIWSMSVQMQIYLGSLLVIAAVAAMFQRHVRSSSQVLHWGLVVATVASFGYATWLGGHDQGANYYSPFSRFWEIGLGGLFGIWLLGRALPAVWARLRLGAGIVGLVLIIGTGLFLDGAAQFPGPWTLVPLAGAMLVVLAGNPVAGEDAASTQDAATSQDAASGVTAMLCAAPFQFLGRIAYSLYLWHWPALVLVTYLMSQGAEVAAPGGGTGFLNGITATLGNGEGFLVGSVVVVVSVLLAWATYRFIETPLRQQAKPERATALSASYVRSSVAGRRGTVGAVCALVMVVATAAVVSFGPVIEHRNQLAAAVDADDIDPAEYPGPAAFLADANAPDDVPVEPDPAVGEEEMLPQTQKDGCFSGFAESNVIFTKQFNSSDEPCVYGDVDSDRTMYLAGGSHSEHYLTGLEEVAEQQGFKIVPLLKMGCVLGMNLPHLSGDPYPECAEWNDNVQQFIFDNPPTDGVFMPSTRPTMIEGDGPDVVPPEYVEMVQRLTDAGIHTWGVRDTPWHMAGPGVQGNARLCVAEGAEDDAGGDCGIAEEASLSPVNPAPEAYEGLDITNIDLTAALCRDGRCPAVVGNVLVYRDGQHFTSLFSSLLAPEISRQMYDAA
ncbi:MULTISPECIES: acyltransferase family protein [unclassified Corynebacterium]|uniref:acyltransferase family protein n=1 Tax=unclassified Corynebacterium TaxID=2624378 RepID=UPI0026493358|nr:acyltransferase family protein [Corynebacterium sp.]MDN5582270.1 acyltransferase [Corynebacterium sp.]MDN5719598.1 acyltransferase [Corynebacterium sp.]